ncbi:MAG: geranylgeranylglycerol-phosphate geranylgeranyltransferase [Bacteroidales bacterium]
MNNISSSLRLWFLKIRPVNLGIVILTQLFYYFFILVPYYHLGASRPALDSVTMIVLLLATLCITAGGYLINDVTDLSADQVNKPSRAKNTEQLTRKALQRAYQGITVTGVALGVFASVRTGSLAAMWIFPVVALGLYLYSVQLQRMVLVGNFLVAFLSGLVVWIVWLFDFFAVVGNPGDHPVLPDALNRSGWIAFVYGLFAFMVTLVREILKDAEDAAGDRKAGYKTLVIRYGYKSAGIVAALFSIIVLAGFIPVLIWLKKQGFIFPFWYVIIVLIPLQAWLTYSVAVYRENPENYRNAGNIAKMVMLAGVLSMQLIYISF